MNSSNNLFRESLNNMTKPPLKIANKERREREFLTPHEIDQLIDAAKKRGRHGHRDATMILLAYRHGLRVSELVSLRWQQIDLTSGVMQAGVEKIIVVATPDPLPLAVQVWAEHAP